MSSPPDLIRSLVDEFADRRPLRAGAFIVTLYGDVVVPRGGSLWIGNVIEACGAVGISETLVRTAVSRLVAAGRLDGLRIGRRSFYRLTEPARLEFERAAAVLYAAAPAGDATAWTVVLAPNGGAREVLEPLTRSGFGMVGSQVAVHPGDAVDSARTQLDGTASGPAPLVFRADLSEPADRETLRRLGGAAWDLDALNAEYRTFIDRYAALSESDQKGMPGALAQSARLLLVHDYRLPALRDPRLPAAVLPPDWSGTDARRLFADLYRALSPAADAHVDAHFIDQNGPLEPSKPVLRQRLTALSA